MTFPSIWQPEFHLFPDQDGIPQELDSAHKQSILEQFPSINSKIVSEDSNQVPLNLQNTLQVLISRMERVEQSSRTDTNTVCNLTTILQSGPYAPIVITNELAQENQGIRGSGNEFYDHL